ncbi:MAG TPA: prenyltransferase/squalene oxidase repeat-containing protein [Humisphaera sp.]|nr:prenyltransferase/squalene oxidase repeat-containing protein [Humisphaera sp.]
MTARAAAAFTIIALLAVPLFAQSRVARDELLPPPLVTQTCSTSKTADEAVPPDVRDAVDKAISWLAAHQRPDGTFPQGGSAGSTAVPSLVVMAFLARGHVPGQGPYGDLLNTSIDYVVESQQPDGLLSRSHGGNHVMYEHGIATVMLSEVYGMVDDARRARVGKVLSRAARLILDAQKAPKTGPQYQGGWRYQVNSPDSDISVTGWQLMALRGAANCGAAIPREALDDGREYIRRSAVPAGGGFGYQPGGGPNQARTGTGILSLELLGEHGSPEAIAGGDYLLKSWPRDASAVSMEFYYYAVYYCAQALNQLGGKYWESLYPRLRESLLTQQQPDGSFGGGSGQEEDAGPSYRSAMACLALCVPYRYLPLYQK